MRHPVLTRNPDHHTIYHLRQATASITHHTRYPPYQPDACAHYAGANVDPVAGAEPGADIAATFASSDHTIAVAAPHGGTVATSDSAALAASDHGVRERVLLGP